VPSVLLAAAVCRATGLFHVKSGQWNTPVMLEPSGKSTTRVLPAHQSSICVLSSAQQHSNSSLGGH
jgi:hypothetical protein